MLVPLVVALPAIAADQSSAVTISRTSPATTHPPPMRTPDPALIAPSPAEASGTETAPPAAETRQPEETRAVRPALSLRPELQKPAGTIRAPIAGPLQQKAPSTPLPPDITSPLSDYSIGTGSEITEGNWAFTVRNNGPTHPKFNQKPGQFGPTSAHYIRFAVGKPCATSGEWFNYVNVRAVPTLGPGEQAKVTFSMDKAHVNNGCKILAKMEAPVNDLNASNNYSITATKTVLLPDLVITNLDGQGKWPGGSIVIKNTGNAPSEPTIFQFYCSSKEPGISCGTLTESMKPAVDRKLPVPALKPGEGYSVMKQVSGVFPGTSVQVSWFGQVDPANNIKEQNEKNNKDALN
jgi:hypothetical protein